MTINSSTSDDDIYPSPSKSIPAGIDLDGDGYISSSEVEEFIVTEGMDNNGDGILNLRDFVCEGSGFRDLVDGDNNGYIDDLLGWDVSGYLLSLIHI